MDRLAREDITAAAAAHRELGSDYDGAVAEGLIERIGDEIDKRVDARLGRRDAVYGQRIGADRLRDGVAGMRGAAFGPGDDGLAPHDYRPARRSRADPGPARSSWTPIVLGLGSICVGAGMTTQVLNSSQSVTPAGAFSGNVGPAQVGILVLIWVVIGVINIAYSRRR
jgi:hypothetical protein